MFIIFNLFCRSVESDEFLIVGPTGYEQRHFKTPSWSFLGVSSTRNAECNQTKMMRIQFCACVIWFIWCISSSFVLGIFFVFPSWKNQGIAALFATRPTTSRTSWTWWAIDCWTTVPEELSMDLSKSQATTRATRFWQIWPLKNLIFAMVLWIFCKKTPGNWETDCKDEFPG